MIRRVLTAAKKLVLGDEVRWHTVRLGPARGLKFFIHGPTTFQRLIGLEEVEILSTMAALGRKSATFLDVGSSDGLYAVLIGSLNPACRLILCDADPERKPFAVGNFEANGIDFAGRGTYMLEMVGTNYRTMDDLLGDAPGPVLVKIDVDGGETDVLRSGEKVLAGRRDVTLVVETHSAELEAECADYLRRLGYDVRIVKNAKWKALLWPDVRPLAHNRWMTAARPAAA